MSPEEFLSEFGAAIGRPLPHSVGPATLDPVVSCQVERLVNEAGEVSFSGEVRTESGRVVWLFTDPTPNACALP